MQNITVRNVVNILDENQKSSITAATKLIGRFSYHTIKILTRNVPPPEASISYVSGHTKQI
jgi:hypothetical protein